MCRNETTKLHGEICFVMKYCFTIFILFDFRIWFRTKVIIL